MYRLVYADFWKDSKVIEKLTPENKLFFLYLLTNPNTTNCGIYQITKKQMAFELGYSMETINNLMDNFVSAEFIKYNADTTELAIKNWGKYNLNKGGKPVIDCLISELSRVKDKTLIKYVGENIKDSCVSIKKLYLLISQGIKISNYVSYLEIERTVQSQGTIQYNTNTIQYNTDTNTNTNTDTDAKNIVSSSSSFSIFKLYESLGFGLLNRNIMDFIESDIEIYGTEWVTDALNEAAKQNKRSLKYVEGILRNWKANGRSDSNEFGENNSNDNEENEEHIYDGYDFSKFYVKNTGKPVEDIETEY